MTVYVDRPQYYETTLRWKWFSHMWSDESEAELHAMAARIGLRREWFQNKSAIRANMTPAKQRYYDHYDITPPKRHDAIRLGAVQMEAGDYLVLHPEILAR